MPVYVILGGIKEPARCSFMPFPRPAMEADALTLLFIPDLITMQYQALPIQRRIFCPQTGFRTRS